MPWPQPLPHWDPEWVRQQLREHLYVSGQSCVTAFQAHGVYKRRDSYNAAIREINFMYVAGDICVDVLAFVPYPDARAGFVMPRLRRIVPSELTSEQKVAIMHELERLVPALHQRGIIHGDIKLANFLYDPSDEKVKFCDFGSAVWIDENIPPYASSDRYCSAKRLRDVALPLEAYDDYYALGWTIWELFTGKIPFQDVPDMYTVVQMIIAGRKPNLDEIENERAKELIRSCCDIIDY